MHAAKQQVGTHTSLLCESTLRYNYILEWIGCLGNAVISCHAVIWFNSLPAHCECPTTSPFQYIQYGTEITMQ